MPAGEDKPQEGNQNLESWFIAGEPSRTPLEEQATLPPTAYDDPPPVLPDPVPDPLPEPKPSSWARYAVLTAAMLAFGGAGAYHFYPKLVRQPDPVPIAPEPAPPPKTPEPPIQTPDPTPAPEPPPIVEERKPVVPAPKPVPKKAEVTPLVESIEPPLPKPAPIPPPVVVVPEPAPTPAPAPPPSPLPTVRPRLTKLEPNTIVSPPPPAYTGPSSGVINWSGRLDKNGSVAIEGLPGVPVMIDLDTKEFAIAEAPSPSNGWRRLVIRSRRKVHSVVTVRWTVVQQ